jgi:hypothetical protein
MKGLLILFGETFRLGGQGNRNRGSDKSYDEQIKAAKTHIAFIEYLKKNKNFDLDVWISSYNTKFDNELIKIYSNVIIGYKFYNNLIGQNGLIHNAFNEIKDINQYEFILFMRVDLYLKEYFFEIFNPNDNKILFPSICFKPHHKVNNHPRVSDMMMFVPKNFFHKISVINIGHNTWHDLVSYHGFTYENIDVMLNTYHDSDSAKDFNPIYYIVNRPQNTVHHTKDDIFNKYNF